MKGVTCKKRTAQSFMEYVLLLVVATSALFLMGAYIKRAFQGRLKGVSDSIGEFYAPGGEMNGELTITSNDTVTKKIVKNKAVVTIKGSENRRENFTLDPPSVWSSGE